MYSKRSPSRQVSPEHACLFSASLLLSPFVLACEFMKRPEFISVQTKILLLLVDPEQTQSTTAKGPSLAERGRAQRRKKAD